MSAEYSTNGRLPALDSAPESLTEAQVRAIFQISHSSISDSIRRGAFPKPIRVGLTSKRWLKSDLVSFLNSQLEQRPPANVADSGKHDER